MIRTATVDDLALVRELWHAFETEVKDAEWRDDDSADDLRELEDAIGKGVVLLADTVGLAAGHKEGARLGVIDFLYVRPKRAAPASRASSSARPPSNSGRRRSTRSS